MLRLIVASDYPSVQRDADGRLLRQPIRRLASESILVIVEMRYVGLLPSNTKQEHPFTYSRRAIERPQDIDMQTFRRQISFKKPSPREQLQISTLFFTIENENRG